MTTDPEDVSLSLDDDDNEEVSFYMKGDKNDDKKHLVFPSNIDKTNIPELFKTILLENPDETTIVLEHVELTYEILKTIHTYMISGSQDNFFNDMNIHELFKYANALDYLDFKKALSAVSRAIASKFRNKSTNQIIEYLKNNGV